MGYRKTHGEGFGWAI